MTPFWTAFDIFSIAVIVVLVWSMARTEQQSVERKTAQLNGTSQTATTDNHHGTATSATN